MISYEKHEGIWYRLCLQKNEPEDIQKQMSVPKLLREKVMEVARDSLFGRYLEVRKMEHRI